MKKTFVVNISFSKKDGCGNEQAEPDAGDIRRVLEVGYSELANLEVSVKEAE